MSSVRIVSRGVPQGSILGPLLKILYTNELPEILRECYSCQHTQQSEEYLFGATRTDCGIIVCYADDATMIITSSSREVNQRKLEQGIDIDGLAHIDGLAILTA